MSKQIQSIISIYSSAFLQGLALVLYPAAGNIFTSEAYHNLSGSEFGLLFTPQIILAIAASLLAPKLAEKRGMKKILLWGLLANIGAMLLFAASAFGIGTGSFSLYLLFLGTACLGTGFGFTITALNPLAYHLFPGKEASSVTGMHIFLGLGTTAASLLLSFFRNLGIWWGAGLFIASLLLLILLFTLSLALKIPRPEASAENSSTGKIPFRVWLFALAIFLYGACEATFGNWGSIYLEKQAKLSIETAALGLAFFWAAIAMGRLIFTFLSIRMNTKMLYLIAPVLVAVVFFGMPFLQGEIANLSALILGGLGLSFFFPNTISLATDEFPHLAGLISGLLVAALQLGTGLSANIVGYFSEFIALDKIFQFSTVYAVIITGLGFYLHFSSLRNDAKINASS